jgi:hypothetical protein
MKPVIKFSAKEPDGVITRFFLQTEDGDISMITDYTRTPKPRVVSSESSGYDLGTIGKAALLGAVVLGLGVAAYLGSANHQALQSVAEAAVKTASESWLPDAVTGYQAAATQAVAAANNWASYLPSFMGQ